VPAVERVAVAATELREHVVEYRLDGDRSIRLLADGEMLDLAAPNGQQIQIVDIGFALQARAMSLLALDPAAFAPGYDTAPHEVDRAVAENGLRALSVAELQGYPARP
jgi:adenosylhomocysteinase